MPLTKQARSTGNFEVLASWLQQTSHFLEEKQLSSGSRRALSRRYLKAAEELLNLQTEASPEEHNLLQRPPATNSNNNKAPRRLHNTSTLSTDASSEGTPLLLHPGVEKLLEEYYQLLESTSRTNTPLAGTNYRPSAMTRLWTVMTQELPPPLRFGCAMERVNKGLDVMAQASVAGIFALLLVWLHVLRLCIGYGVTPAVTLGVFVLGLSILTRSQGKRHASATDKRQWSFTLKPVTVAEGVASLDSAARPYVKCTEMGRTVKPLGSIRWPSNLPRPSVSREYGSVASPTHASEESPNVLQSLHKDIEEIQLVVMGGDSMAQTPTSPQNQNIEFIISSIQNLCQVIGVEPIKSDKQDLVSLRSKIAELRTAIGI